MRLYTGAMILFCIVAEPVPPVNAQTFEVTPFVGWETSGSYPLENPTDVAALRAGAAKTYGLFVDYSLTENLQAELLWASNPTTYSAQSTATGQYDRSYTTHVDQYQCGALYLLRGKQNSLRPYISGGVGLTHDAASGGNPSRAALGFGLGAGVKYTLSGHLAIRSDVRWMPTYGSSGVGTFCDNYGGYGGDYGYGDYGGGCYQDTIHNYLQRFNVGIGLTIRP
jgi:Outer membrane protein beta-barrel domain